MYGGQPPTAVKGQSMQSAIPQAATQASWWNKVIGKDQNGNPMTMGAMLAGLGASAAPALAGMMIPQPKAPDFNATDTFNQIRSQANMGPTTPEGKAAATAMLSNIQNPQDIFKINTDEYKAAIQKQAEDSMQRALSKVDTFHAQNGTFGGSDHQRERDEVIRQYENDTKLQQGALDQEVYGKRMDAYLSNISEAYQMDKANLEQIAGLTNMTIYEVALKYGLKAQEVSDFRQALQGVTEGIMPSATMGLLGSLGGK